MARVGLATPEKTPVSLQSPWGWRTRGLEVQHLLVALCVPGTHPSSRSPDPQPLIPSETQTCPLVVGARSATDGSGTEVSYGTRCVPRVSGEEGRGGPARGGSYDSEGRDGFGGPGAGPLAGRPRWRGWLE